MHRSTNVKIGRYEIVGQLATGGMAAIVLARLVGPSGFERLVVIKRMLPHLRSDSMREMFLEEARILAGIRHTNVVQVEELAANDGEPFLAMEYLEGESAAGLLRRLVAQRRTLPADLAAYIVAEACAGLHAAHELRGPEGARRGLVHRDVSPQNVFVTYDGTVKVLDFGIAKSNDANTRKDLTKAGELKGKFEYMSPEQTTGAALDCRSDVFSLGIVLYELATARSLFHRRTHLLTMKAICEEPIVRPSRVLSTVPKAIDAVCARALKRTLEARYATAAAMRRELLPLATLPGAEEPRDRLAALMRELFADRIAEKEDMIRRVRAGSSVDDAVLGEADTLVSVPTVLDVAVGRKRSVLRRAWTTAGAIVAVGAAAAILARSSARTDEVVVATPAVSAAAIPATAPSSSAVVLTIDSTPQGAKVSVDASQRGTTPATLEVPRGTRPIVIALDKSGFAAVQREIVPATDVTISIALVREPKREGPVAPVAPPAKVAAPRASFERFD
ncbi:MAG: protein kinase [Labilithrix sp.]|nr:protein kinase [Labilithrix sp.]